MGSESDRLDLERERLNLENPELANGLDDVAGGASDKAMEKSVVCGCRVILRSKYLSAILGGCFFEATYVRKNNVFGSGIRSNSKYVYCGSSNDRLSDT